MTENVKIIKLLRKLTIIFLCINIVFLLTKIVCAAINYQKDFILVMIDWILNLTFAILSGTIISIVIAIINYKTYLIRNAEKLVFLIYEQGCKLEAIIYNENKTISVEVAKDYLTTFDIYANQIQSILFEIKNNLILKYKKYTSTAEFLFKSFYKRCRDNEKFNFYIINDENHFNENNKYVYDLLENNLNNSELYKAALDFSDKLGCLLYSEEKSPNKEEIKIKHANDFKEKVEKYKKSIEI